MEGCPVVGVAGELAVVQHGHDLVADTSIVLSIISIVHDGDPRGWRRDAVDLEHGLWLRRLLGWRGRRRGRGRGFCVSEFVPKLQVISHGGGGQGGRGAGQAGGGGWGGGGGGEVL